MREPFELIYFQSGVADFIGYSKFNIACKPVNEHTACKGLTSCALGKHSTFLKVRRLGQDLSFWIKHTGKAACTLNSHGTTNHSVIAQEHIHAIIV